MTSPPRTILLIEDTPEDRVMVRRALAADPAHSNTIFEAATAAEGLRLWREHTPDCVLLDHNLPDRDGLAVLRTLVTEGGADAGAIVLLTGTGDTQLAVEALKEGAHDYLDKNHLSPETLRHALNNAIEKAALRRQLDEQREWLHVTLASIGDAVIATDTAGQVTFLNPVAAALTGWTQAEAAGQPVSEVFRIVSEETRATVESPVEKVLRESVVIGLANHTILLAKDGREIPIDDSAAPIRDETGALRGVVLVFRDITARRHAEAKLRASEARLRVIYDSAHEYMGLLTPDGTLREANHAMLEFAGSQHDEVVGRPFWETVWFQYTPGAPELVRAALTRAATGEFVRIEAPLINPGGETLTFDLAFYPIHDEKRKVILIVLEGRDLTERKRAEAERERLLRQEQRAREAAEAATQAKDEFLAVVSHELRNPLNSILGYTRITRMQAQDVALVERNCEIIERSAKMQQRLIEDLLDTARILSGKLKIEAAPMDLRLVLEDALRVVQPTAEAKQVELVARLGDEPQPIFGDAARLQQVAWNLLQNAIKFTPDGGRVELQMQRNGQQIRLIVSDTGRGIEPEFLPAVFDRFSQSDMSRTRQHGGLGLGLALVEQLVELHGGTIAAASAGTEQGASFTVTLPLRAPQLAEQLPPTRAIAEFRADAEAIPLDGLPRLDGVSILVVDDHEEARQLIAYTLSEWGAVVKAAASGREARALLTDGAFDVLVCDISMPHEDGYEVLTRLRAFEHERGMPFSERLPAIALTAMASAEDRLQALRAGFQMHVTKPVEPAELIMVIASLIGDQARQ